MTTNRGEWKRKTCFVDPTKDKRERTKHSQITKVIKYYFNPFNSLN